MKRHDDAARRTLAGNSHFILMRDEAMRTPVQLAPMRR
jgi:hypothetical protein